MVAVSLKKDFFQAEDGIRDLRRSRGLGDVYKRQGLERGKVIEQGYLEAGGNPERLERVKSLFEANDKLKQRIRSGDIVLYENDLPDIYNE